MHKVIMCYYYSFLNLPILSTEISSVQLKPILSFGMVLSYRQSLVVNMHFHAKSWASNSKNGRVMAVGTKEDIERQKWKKEKQNVFK